MNLYSLNSFEAWQVRLFFTTGARIDLYETIAEYLRDGIDVYTILTKLGAEYTKATKGDVRAMILREWAAAMDIGALAFSEAVRPWVPPSEVMLFKAGEDSGELAEALDNVIFATGTVRTMFFSVLKSLSYPTILLLLFGGMVYGIAAFMVPNMENVVPREKWPASSQGLATISDYVRTSWYMIIIYFVGTIFAFKMSVSHIVGPIRVKMDKFPPWNLSRSIQSSVFLITIASQMKAGVPLVDALENMKALSGKYVSFYIRQMLIRMNADGDIGSALDSGFLDKETGIKVRLLAETSGLENGMDSIGKKAIKGTQSIIEAVSKVVQTLVLMMIAAFIAWTFLSMNAVNQTIAQGV